MAEPTESERTFDVALDSLHRAYREAAEAIGQVGEQDLQQAFECASVLADDLRAVADAAAGVRSLAAARIFDEERLSLAGLANRIGTSKARAGQLVQNARKLQNPDQEG